MINAFNLNAGDKIRRVESSNESFDFTIGKSYEVLEDASGSVFIREDDGTKYNLAKLSANDHRWEHVVAPEKVGYVSIDEVTRFYCDLTEITLRVNDAGLIALRALEKRSRGEEEATKLDVQIAQVEETLARLKAEKETIE